MTAQSRLDQLADALDREVRHAAALRSKTELAAEFDGMTAALTNETALIETYAGVVASESSPLTFEPEVGESLSQRTEWIVSQVDKVRRVLGEDPMKVRQGKVWGETQRAIKSLRSDLESAVDEAYAHTLDSFRGDDRDVLDTLPPGTSGVARYREAIEEFERLALVRPSSADDVVRAAAAGRRMQAKREEVEAEAVPAQFSAQWRVLRTTGLRLADASPSFLAWLDERGLSGSAVLKLGSR